MTPVTSRRQIANNSSSRRATPLRTDRKHVIDTTTFENGCYDKPMVTIFAPADVNYDEIIKSMHPAYDMRYLRPTSTKGDKQTTNYKVQTTQRQCMQMHAHSENVK